MANASWGIEDIMPAMVHTWYGDRDFMKMKNPLLSTKKEKKKRPHQGPGSERGQKHSKWTLKHIDIIKPGGGRIQEKGMKKKTRAERPWGKHPMEQAPIKNK